MILCKEGFSLSFYQKKRSWLHAEKKRRLFFISETEETLADPQVRIFWLRSPLQKEQIAQMIGEMTPFYPLDFQTSAEWQERILAHQRRAFLLVSDAADFGVGLLRNLLANFQKPMRSLAKLQNFARNIPAIIVGAGPSLEKNGHLLASFREKALLIGAGSGARVMQALPHLAVAVDPHVPLQISAEVPLCIASRTHPDAKGGERFYIPDSHFAFEPWLTGVEERFAGGWTVGNTAAAIAAYFGCNPIILVGMDYCDRAGQKYAGEKGGLKNTIAAIDAEGKCVETQSDWLAAIRWMEEFSVANPTIEFLNATGGGMRIGGAFRTAYLQELSLPTRKIDFAAKMGKAPRLRLKKARLKAWKKSLEKKDPFALELLLEPLWKIWGPLFECELMSDPEPIPLAEKIAIQKDLFFNQVMQDHLNAANGN